MKHYGDITKIDGREVEIVDCITGGSPCQDLSTANSSRAGLAGERSGLFMEQIRIVKEMREHDVRTNNHRGIFIRPRFMVWENVPGAFTSNNGEDFRAVLEETARIADPKAIIPRPTKNIWTKSGAIMGDGWSIAWRVHDSQFWGSAQRRARIALVADFGEQSAADTLFERRSVCGVDPKDEEDWDTNGRNRIDTDSTEPILIEMGSTKHTVVRTGIVPTLKSRMGTGGNNVHLIVEGDKVRELSCVEVERLQGFPDGWTDIGDWIDSTGKKRKMSHASQMKALGNSICTPFWFWLLRRISSQYERPATLASLFDGIGGFPYCWEKCNGKGTAIWASEIEEFPMAVTKIRFPEDGE